MSNQPYIEIGEVTITRSGKHETRKEMTDAEVEKALSEEDAAGVVAGDNPSAVRAWVKALAERTRSVARTVTIRLGPSVLRTVMPDGSVQVTRAGFGGTTGPVSRTGLAGDALEAEAAIARASRPRYPQPAMKAAKAPAPPGSRVTLRDDSTPFDQRVAAKLAVRKCAKCGEPFESFIAARERCGKCAHA